MLSDIHKVSKSKSSVKSKVDTKLENKFNQKNFDKTFMYKNRMSYQRNLIHILRKKQNMSEDEAAYHKRFSSEYIIHD